MWRYSVQTMYAYHRSLNLNSLLVSLPAYQTDRIQIVLNDAAWLIFSWSRRDHVTPILRHRLHWLRAPQRIEFKVTLLMYKGINNLAPDYITSYRISVSTNQRRSTKSPSWCTRESTTWHQITSPATAYQAASINVVSHSDLQIKAISSSLKL